MKLTDSQIKHMVDRFLCWKLPEDFNPDGGISFKKTFNDHLPQPQKHEPVGTNLFSADQATAMVRYLVEDASQGGSSDQVERPPPVEQLELIILIEFVSDPAATRRAAERVWTYLEARAKTLARQTTTSVLPRSEGQAAECDGGLRTAVACAWKPSDEELAGWARNWHWNDCAEDKPVDPSIYFRDMRMLKAYIAKASAFIKGIAERETK